MTADLEAVTLASVDSNLDDEHDPEGSTVAFERAQLFAMLTRTQSHLVEVDAALWRLATHVYGLCVRCDNPIADDRLAAMPSARTCIAVRDSLGASLAQGRADLVASRVW